MATLSSKGHCDAMQLQNHPFLFVFRKAKIRQKFMEFDKNNTGYVTAIDAHRILSKELGFPEKKTEALVSSSEVCVDVGQKR